MRCQKGLGERWVVEKIFSQELKSGNLIWHYLKWFFSLV